MGMLFGGWAKDDTFLDKNRCPDAIHHMDLIGVWNEQLKEMFEIFHVKYIKDNKIFGSYIVGDGEIVEYKEPNFKLICTTNDI